MLPNLRIDSFGSLVGAALLIAAVCFSERILTLAILRHWNPLPVLRRTRLRVSIWRTVLYWVVTFERMLYMLAAMSLNLWILIMIVTSLAVGQFIIEVTETTGSTANVNDVSLSDAESGYLLPRHSRDVNGMKEPLLAASTDDYELDSASPYQQEHHYPSQQTYISQPASRITSYPHSISPSQMSPSFQYTPPPVSEQTALATTRPRSKSKPDGIFIHPTHSNIARAEVIAVRMGLDTQNEYVDPSSYTYPRSPSQTSDSPAQGNRRGWGTGNARDVARGLFDGSNSTTNAGS